MNTSLNFASNGVVADNSLNRLRWVLHPLSYQGIWALALEPDAILEEAGSVSYL